MRVILRKTGEGKMIFPGREPAKGGLSGMGILKANADRSPGPAPLDRVLGLMAIGHPLSLALEQTWHTLADEWPPRNFKPQYREHIRYLDGGWIRGLLHPDRAGQPREGMAAAIPVL